MKMKPYLKSGLVAVTTDFPDSTPVATPDIPAAIAAAGFDYPLHRPGQKSALAGSNLAIVPTAGSGRT